MIFLGMVQVLDFRRLAGAAMLLLLLINALASLSPCITHWSNISIALDDEESGGQGR